MSEPHELLSIPTSMKPALLKKIEQIKVERLRAIKRAELEKIKLREDQERVGSALAQAIDTIHGHVALVQQLECKAADCIKLETFDECMFAMLCVLDDGSITEASRNFIVDVHDYGLRYGLLSIKQRTAISRTYIQHVERQLRK